MQIPDMPPGHVSGKMDHVELLSHLGTRFTRVEAKLDKLDEKLDEYVKATTKNTSDLEWVKGSIKAGAALLLATVGSLATALINFFYKGN